MENSTFHKPVLLIGSGLSASAVSKLKRPLSVHVIAVNNAWQVNPTLFDWWFTPTDYEGTRPSVIHSHQYYVTSYIKELNRYGGIEQTGYSTVLNALYWSHVHGARCFGLIGCDMNYTPVDGKTHVYGIGYDIRKTGESDPDRMIRERGKGKADYLTDIYTRFVDVTGSEVYNLSDDLDSRLPYPRLSMMDFLNIGTDSGEHNHDRQGSQESSRDRCRSG